MGCLLSVFKRSHIDKKKQPLLQKNDDNNINRQQYQAFSIQNQYINQEKDEIQKPHKQYKKIKCFKQNKMEKFYVVSKEKDNQNKFYFLKTIKTLQYLYQGLDQQIQNEIQILKQCKGKFLIKYYEHFTTQTKTYIIAEYQAGGTLKQYMNIKKLNEDEIKFYIAEILLGLIELHNNNVIYRNLNPSSIFINENGHIKLCDYSISHFGFQTNLISGNIYYQAPEIMKLQYQNKLADYWSLGAIMYEMLIGYPPYFHQDLKIYKFKKFKQQLYLPDFISNSAKELLKQLLSNKPEDRIKIEDVKTIQQHDFFKDMNWELIQKKEQQPPFIPQLLTKSDIKYLIDENKIENQIDTQAFIQNQQL